MNNSECLPPIAQWWRVTYFERVSRALDARFPEGDPGEDTDVFFHKDYISRDNKRRHGLSDEARRVTRITYGLAVSAEAAPLFKAEGATTDIRLSLRARVRSPRVH